MLIDKIKCGIGNTAVSPIGQAEFTTPGTYYWTAPAGVTSVCVVCIGGGGSGAKYNSSPSACGGGGGGLGWANNIQVTPGVQYEVVVGGGGASVTSAYSSANGLPGNNSVAFGVIGFGGKGGIAGNTILDSDSIGGLFVGDGGGIGGRGGAASFGYKFGGGGAGGYSGNGGNGATRSNPAQPGIGGGGGGGGAQNNYTAGNGGGGGGVGIYGEGANGMGGANAANAARGAGGSGGIGGGITPYGGNYGGGGGGGSNAGYSGGSGAVRIIWGNGRAFPSTMTGDM